MAAGSVAQDPMEDLREKATCSVCLEFFKDPVALECGHNFCRSCLIHCWEKPGNAETSCPQCRIKVLQSNLKPNQLVASFVEIAKKLSLQRPRKAEGRKRVCEKHKEPLNLFCEDDKTLICEQCNSSQEHFDHRVIPLKPPVQDYKVGMTALSAAKDPMEEETTCSDCLEYFKDSVSFKCGHTFCRSCPIQRWEKSVTKETSCPLCRKKVLQEQNQQLANIAETTKKLSLQGPRKAEGRERVCEKYQEPITLFYENDETPICEMCEQSKEHRDQRTIPLGTSVQDYKVDLASSAAKDPIEDEVTCSVCLEYFKEPVTLECGHNFCRSCVTQCWEKSVTKETFCPQCREKVQQRNLKSNWQLANIVEFSKKRPQGPRSAEGKESVCRKHQEPLKLFCKDDETPICLICDRSKDHKEHTVIPMEEAAHYYEAILEKKEKEILAYKAETEKEAQDLLKRTEAEMENILGEITEIRQILEEQEKHFRAQMEELQEQIARKRDENLAMFDQELSSLKKVIQKLKEKWQQPPVELLQDVKSLLQRSEEKKTFQKPVASFAELKLKTWELYDQKLGLVPAMKQFQDTLFPVLELQKANVTLDPYTAGRWLFLSEDHKSVRHRDELPNLPDKSDNPERFSNPFCILGLEGFTRGRHFWEVVVEGEGNWFVGVARKSVRRKDSVRIGPEGGIWAVGKWKDRNSLSINPSSSALSLSEKVKRVRVCLNFAADQVAFYDADTGEQIRVFSEVPFFGETVLPFFYVDINCNLRISSSNSQAHPSGLVL